MRENERNEQESKADVAEPKAARKKLPPYLILAIIAVASALVLGLTNLVTADPIAERQSDEKNAAFKAVIPGGDKLEYAELSEDLREVRADGVVAGYAVKASAPGYGGDVAVVLGFDAAGTVVGAQVGDGGFQETSGIGAKWLNGDNVSRLLGLSATEGGTFDAISGATVTSTAVLNAVNAGMRTVAKELGAEPGTVSFGSAAAQGYAVSSSTATSSFPITSRKYKYYKYKF